MPELIVAGQRWSVAAQTNLLDALNAQGLAVPYSCRAGSCHACLVQCLQGEPEDFNPTALEPAKREQGWRLACQCRVVADLAVAVFDPRKDGVGAQVLGCDWLSPGVLRLRLASERPLRYQVGQHLVLWTASGVARPYSLASLPQEDEFLEFHLDCRQPGAFSDVARQLTVGSPLRLGELSGGALHYDPDWQQRPLWLLAAGTGLAPLWGVLREALRQAHQGPIQVVHVAHEHYLAEPLRALAACHPQIHVQLLSPEQAPSALATWRLQSRQTIAQVCGSPASVEHFSRRLYLMGLPRNQLLADMFVERR
ncbi:MAG: iron-sulfur-binding ferredoxin reductase [Pseudomonas sp.]|uniref:iron-sulfur-binding ferredoxin reductase n=1 Tax=Pseudomonas abieticivorans TaxID=2931382 RepID=UPI0020C001E0|nr:iron-sulfur-binding ferredoxin reductase [Pseudomonas sp. PIA16]MDE1163924.1 iron-sulfur-binding ferredoxin reductase [Pseudomonas sp.]